MAQHCQKYTSHQKSFKLKLFRIEFRPKKFPNAYVYVSPEWSWVARKIGNFEVLLCTETANYIQFRAQPCQKYASHQKSSNKSCLELNLVQKSPWTHMSISPLSGVRGLERLACSKYYYFNLGLNAAKKYASHQKRLQIRVVRNWILSKEARKRICLFPPGVELGGLKD